jgi:HEAT repeat protein
LRAATVALEIPGQAADRPIRATGFFVAPGIVATCAHALSDTRAALPDNVVGYLIDGQPIALETVPEWYLRAEPGGLDLAFLRAMAAPEIQHVLLSGALTVRDPMWAYGHPAGKFRAGQSAGFRYQGPSRLQAAGGQWEPHRLTGTPVGGGYSGSPVLNLRTGAVCGMLCTSDDAGSAHMVTADDIMSGHVLVRETQATPTANTRWLRALSDEQLTVGGWLFPGPRLRAYLDAAVRAAEEHPYPGVVPGIAPPPLTAVYVRQQAETLSVESDESPEQTSADLEKRPAEEVLGREGDCVLVGGPGAGKSSLLRTALTTLVRRWQRGEPGTEVPVYVLASDLIPARPLPDLITASVTASLSAVGILKSWPSEFFGDTPLRGVRWLVLVDGLDEVLDPVARRRVLDKIAGAGRAEAGSPYRFIVATRPLVGSEFPAQDCWLAPRYELQLFAHGQLSEFAERWFSELRLSRPQRAAADFVAALDRAGLADPARTPLMATMLCQLFAANPDRELPAGRSGAYTEFVELLRQRQYEDATSGIYAQMHTLLGPYGPSATEAAGTVLVTAIDLIARLALHRQDGGDGRSVDLLAGWTRASRPRHVPEQKWLSFLRELLRRSGLLTQRADDFQFIHQTVGEYLAAQCVTADKRRTAAAYRELFGRWHVGGDWRQPSWDDSYSRFLIAAWPDKSDLVKPLRRLARNGRLPGCRFIASLFADSALPDSDIAAEAAATLMGFAGARGAYFPVRREACEVLAQLRDPRGGDLLADLAADRAISPTVRQQAAETLARLGDARGADLLSVLAGPSEPDRIARRWAAEALARLGDPRGAGRLLDIAADRDFAGAQRVEAVRALIQLDDNRRLDQLAALVRSGLLDNESGRREVIAALIRLVDQRYADLLVTFAADSTIFAAERAEAALALTRFGDQRGMDLLATLAEADGISVAVETRLMAAEALAEVNDTRGPRVLADLAADPEEFADVYIRRQSAMALARLANADLLLDLAVDSAIYPHRRYAAAEALSWIDESRHLRALTCLLTDSAADAAIRVNAGRALIRAGGRRGPDLVVALAVEPALDISNRCKAAWIVAQSKDRRASLLRQILLSVDSAKRRLATQALERLAGGHAVRLLEALTGGTWRAQTDSGSSKIIWSLDDPLALRDRPLRPDQDHWFDIYARLLDEVSDYRPIADVSGDGLIPLSALDLASEDPRAVLSNLALDESWAARSNRSFDDFPRRRAAEALAWLGDLHGANFLAAVAADDKTPVHARLDATAALARLEDPRAADLLMAIIRDEALEPADRIQAAATLVLLDEPVPASWLADVATDRSADERARDAAGENRTSLGASLLVSLANDPGRDAAERIEAAEALAQDDAKRAVTVLVGLSSDEALDVDSRARAAEALAMVSDPSTADQLAALAADSALPVYTRIEVAGALANLAHPRAASLLAAIADDPAHDIHARRWANDALKNIGPAGDH